MPRVAIPIRPLAFLGGVVLFVLGTACSDPDADIIRGHGLKVAQMTATSRAHVYEAALHAAFHLDDPALVLLMHPRILPRTASIDGGDSVPKTVRSALENDGAIRGLCDPEAVAGQKTPRCSADRPGYVVRFSDVLTYSADTVEVYLSVTGFETKAYPKQAYVAFENVYQIAKTADGWTAAREGRVPK